MNQLITVLRVFKSTIEINGMPILNSNLDTKIESDNAGYEKITGVAWIWGN